MKRKHFIRIFAVMPWLHVPFTLLGSSREKTCKTEKDVEGPFYKVNAPARTVIEVEGEPLIIEGRVLRSDDCETPAAGAVLDVWHCDTDGNYDMRGYNCRGKVTTNKAGQYTFKTILPPPYGTRPRHIHIKVSAPGCSELTTQLYFQGDPQIKNDFARYAEKNRVIHLTLDKGIRKGKFDIYL